MKNSILIFLLLIFTQLNGQAWPNSLVFTLKPIESDAYRNNTLGFEVIEESDGIIFIGKFKNSNQAEVAQQRLESVGVKTEMLAFFRMQPIAIEEALILSENMNTREETTMITGTIPTSTNENSEDIITNDTIEQPIEENTINPEPESVNNDEISSYFTIQVGVFSKSAKQKFQMEVEEKVINEKYYCFYGRYAFIEDAKLNLEKIKEKGYNDAFITGFSGDKKVSPKEIKK